MRDIRNWYKLLEGQGLAAGDSGPGAAQGTLSANVAWLPFYSPPRSTTTVSGTLSPDAAGVYPLKGIYNSKPYWSLSTTWHHWFDPAAVTWYISELLGTPGSRGWSSESSEPLGEHAPYGTATGNANVASPYTMPYDQKGVIIGPSVSRITSAAAAGFPAAQGSIEMLVRPYWNNADSIPHTLWNTAAGNNQQFILLKDANNLTYLYTQTISRGSFTFAWTAHQLYHIVLNWGTNQLYINNLLVKDYTNAGLGTGASTLYIGDQPSGLNKSFNGIVYYFIARDTPLTLAEIDAFRSFFQNLYIPQIT